MKTAAPLSEPQTLLEAIRYFADPDISLRTMVELRWPQGVHCPTCGRADVRFIATRRLWECKEKHPKRQFSAKVGTIFEDSPVDLGKWFAAIWMVANCKNGISSYEMHRALGVTQKTAWFMDHRIRLAMQTGSVEKMSGSVEADESFVGGLSKNMHASRRKRVIGDARGHAGKEVVMGVLRRTDKASGSKSKVRAEHIPDVRGDTLHAQIRSTIEPGSRLYTDSWVGYRGLDADYEQFVINHAVAYVEGHVHTNGIENFWSLLKRTIKGTYVSVEPFHLGRYLDEQTFRFNERDDTDGGRFRKVISSIAGRRLTYDELIGHAIPTKDPPPF
ncbi:MAG: IS1595 family transposase [Stellaceae bacterium]